MPPAFNRKRRPNAHIEDDIARKRNRRLGVTAITHDKHRGGPPPSAEMCHRFSMEEYGDDTDDLEVVGYGGFVHARCPWSSSKPCQCGRYSCHLDSLIVAVDGACPGNGTPAAVASGCGVYFGDIKDNCTRRNMSFRVPDDSNHPHTSQRAELHAAIAAVKVTAGFACDGGQWPCDSSCSQPCKMTHLVVKSDSVYLVNGITQSINKWMQNGWRTVKNTPVRNRDLWEELVDAIDILDDFQVSVGSWLVPREKNTRADALSALGVHSKRVFMDWGLLGEY